MAIVILKRITKEFNRNIAAAKSIQGYQGG